MNPVKIISYNINGIRAGMKKGLVDWLKSMDADVVCFQETKATPDQFDTGFFEELGYHHYWHSAEKKGYSGVGVLSRQEPDSVTYGCGMDEYDCEGRVLQLNYGGVTVVNTYFPSGSSGDARQAVKMRFLGDYHDYISELKKERPNLLICGDYNICHKPIDIHDPVRNANTSGFKPEEREWMDLWFDNGFVDSFRHFNPGPHQYSWWSYRAAARERNKGWRIDYISATEPLKENLLEAKMYQDAMHSDHCPVYLKLNF